MSGVDALLGGAGEAVQCEADEAQHEADHRGRHLLPTSSLVPVLEQHKHANAQRDTPHLQVLVQGIHFA